jgi:hypothetical protein
MMKLNGRVVVTEKTHMRKAEKQVRIKQGFPFLFATVLLLTRNAVHARKFIKEFKNDYCTFV